MPVSAGWGCASAPDVPQQLLESGSCSVNGLLWHECHASSCLMEMPSLQSSCSEQAQAGAHAAALGDTVMLGWVTRCHAPSLNPLTFAAGTPPTQGSHIPTWVTPCVLWIFSPSALKASTPWPGLRLRTVGARGWV